MQSIEEINAIVTPATGWFVELAVSPHDSSEFLRLFSIRADGTRDKVGVLPRDIGAGAICAFGSVAWHYYELGWARTNLTGPAPQRPPLIESLGPKDFFIGVEFFCEGNRWRCTDIGTRVIVAISLEPHEVVRVASSSAEPHGAEVPCEARCLTDDPSWANGPPYAVSEHVFDEDDMQGCSLAPTAYDAGQPKYHQLEITANLPATEIWLSDDAGFLVKKAVGTLTLGLLPGDYAVEFGLGTALYPVHLDQAKRLTQAELQTGPTCARPVFKLLPH